LQTHPAPENGSAREGKANCVVFSSLNQNIVDERLKLEETKVFIDNAFRTSAVPTTGTAI